MKTFPAPVLTSPDTHSLLEAPRSAGEVLATVIHGGPGGGWGERLGIGAARRGSGNEWHEVGRRTLTALTAASEVPAAGAALDAAEIAGGATLFVTGHQPEPPHAGVWLKSFVAAQLAKHLGGQRLHIVADHDRAAAPALRVPGFDGSSPTSSWISYDGAARDATWEESTIADPALFSSFGERASAAMAGLAFEPMVTREWPVHGAPRSGERFTASRRAVEGRWGLAAAELPASRMSETDAFAAFTAAIVRDADHFAAAYNRARAAYRVRAKVRNDSHPVPALGLREGWVELPFWALPPGHTRRLPLWVRRDGERLLLGDRCEAWAAPRSDADLGEWLALLRGGLPLRPRALLLTLFLRLVPGAVFVHGVGGARYDQITDDILRDYCGVAPPPYLAVTATLTPPLPRCDVARGEWQLANRSWRDWRYNPDRDWDLEGAGMWKAWAEEKRALFAAAPSSRRARRERFLRIRALNEAMGSLTAPEGLFRAARRDRLAQALAANEHADYRGYAWYFYPEPYLRGFLEAASQAVVERG